jgi:CMP-N-acetylneuraminic acid synthetase
MEKNEIIAVVPARKGSVGLPGKNVKVINGIPLVEHSILQAVKSSKINRVIVTTDCPDVANIARKYSEKVSLVLRPEYLSLSESKTEDAVMHACSTEALSSNVEAIVLLQPTSPVRTCSQIDESISLFRESKKKCLVSVTEPLQHPSDFVIERNGRLEFLFRNKGASRRQDFHPAYFMNGSIYITNFEYFMTENKIYDLGDCELYHMPMESSIDIDTQFDFDLCECVMKQKEE